MYYPENVIDEVRQANPIADVIGTYVHLTRKGGNYFGLCPFHNEKTGSFSVSPSRGIYHCFGCGKGGNVITFVMEYENMTFPEAVESLAARGNVVLPKREETPEQKKEASRRERLFAMHKDAAVFYCHVLRSPEGKIGLDYLKKRGVSDEMIRSFGLGYGTQKPDALYRYLKSKGYRDDEIDDEAGLTSVMEKGCYDRFWNRVIFPIMDTGNRVIGFGGRVIGKAEPKYMNSKETRIFDKRRNLYGLNAAKRTKEKYMLVCEGYMDVIAMHQAGFTNAVASLGTAFTVQHGAILKRYVDEAILCYDTDGPGRKAALRAIPILKEAGLRVKVLDMTPHKDPDEFIRALGKEAFEERIKSAENGFLFQMRMMRSEYDFADPDDKTAFIHGAAAALAKIGDEAERTSYMEAVSKTFRLDYSILKSKTIEFGNRAERTQPAEETFVVPKKPPVARNQAKGPLEAEKIVLIALTEHPEYYPAVKAVISPEDFTKPVANRVASALFRALENGRTPSAAAILDGFVDDETYEEAASVFASAYEEILDETAEKEAVREALLRIRSASLDEKIRETADTGKLMELMAEKKKLAGLQVKL